jgi:hypothetical protein
VVYGISEKSEVVDTLNLGQKRSLGDVMFRRHEFDKEYSERDQKRLANILSGAIRLVWLRMGGKQVSDAPHFPHSEALEVLKTHPKIKDCVQFIYTLEGGQGAEGRQISSKVSLAYAAAMMYLMATAKTDPDGGDLNFSLQKKAEKFWESFATGANLEKDSPILSLRTLLEKMDASSSKSRDAICWLIAKAWNAHIDGEAMPVKSLRLKESVDKESGKRVLAEFPRIGGLDVEHEPEEGEEATGWTVGDTAYFWGEKEELLFGQIEAINNAKGEVDVRCKEDKALYNIPTEGLMIEKPSEEEVEA